jgi:hypothetical protein
MSVLRRYSMRRSLASWMLLLLLLALAARPVAAQSGTGRISGLVTDTRVPPRIIQLGLKFYF